LDLPSLMPITFPTQDFQSRQSHQTTEWAKSQARETRHFSEDASLWTERGGSLVSATRYLIVTADDFGIGPETSRGILELATEGLVTCTVLLVNSPHAPSAVAAWKSAGRPVELGWHPCLTLDRPVLPAREVPTLVRPDATFWPLAGFVRRLLHGQIREREIDAELTAQSHRFRELVGHLPTSVNSHHHVQVFPPVGRILLDVLQACGARPYVRCIREAWPLLASVPGARIKRLVLSMLGRPCAWRQTRLGFPGNDWLAGITDPPWVKDPEFLARWLSRLPGTVVELTCHPGHRDETLLGRDATATDGQMQRRVDERTLLRQTNFRQACQLAGFTLTAPSAWMHSSFRGAAHAA
jgi:predicted glycoside hydrolase/deacetylase ChbG (UPF0249 family)